MRPTRSLLHMLLALAVLLCGLHIGEPAHAENGAGEHAATHAIADTGHADSNAPDQDEGADHHHCPMAPAIAAPDDLPVFAAVILLDTRPGASLRSLTRAPPIEPPAA